MFPCASVQTSNVVAVCRRILCFDAELNGAGENSMGKVFFFFTSHGRGASRESVGKGTGEEGHHWHRGRLRHLWHAGQALGTGQQAPGTPQLKFHRRGALAEHPGTKGNRKWVHGRDQEHPEQWRLWTLGHPERAPGTSTMHHARKK